MRLLQLLAIALLFIQCSLNIPDAVVIEMENLPEKVDYNYHIKPILSDRCYQCHGPDEKTRKAGLRLDLYHRAHWHEGKLYYKGKVVMEKA